MKLFEAVPENLFSILASQNKELYADALDVLYAAYGERLRIPEEEFFKRLCERLEKSLVKADFNEEGISDEEQSNISGRARFLIRLLSERGWFERENGSDFVTYLIVPGYSSMLMDLFHRLREDSPTRGYSLVFGTYSILQVADEKYDAYEKMSAVYSAYENTQSLIKLLQQVHYDIRSYYKQLLNMSDEGKILASHYDNFSIDIIEKRIYPLKIKDSVPKFKVPIQAILKKWREDETLMSSMAECALGDKRGSSKDECLLDIAGKIEKVISHYDTFTALYLDEIDREHRRYTSTTTHKIESLSNREHDVTGNINYLMRALCSEHGEELTEKIASIFCLHEHSFISEDSVKLRKAASRKVMTNPVKIKEHPIDDGVKAAATKLMQSKFGRSAINEYIDRWLGTSNECNSRDMDIPDDMSYIVSLLVVLTSGEKSTSHVVKLENGEVDKGEYEIPEYILRRKRSK